MSCHVLTKHLAQMEFKAVSRKISPHCDCVRTMIEGRSSLYSADGSSSKFNSSPFFLQLTGSQGSTHYGFKRDSDANRISLFVDNDGWMNALTLSRVKLWPDNYDTTEHYTTQIERRRAGDTIGDTAV